MTLEKEVLAAYAVGRNPRVHPNGFLQLDLTDDKSRRLHIFDAHLPRQTVRTSYHDHIFDMHSEVIKGCVYNDVLDVVPDPEGLFEVHQAQTTKCTETNLNGTTQRVSVVLRHTVVVPKDGWYTFPAFEFHDSRHDERTVTVMNKQAVKVGTPRVLVPVGAEPDNSFSREDQDINALWAMIEDTLL